MVQKSIPDFQLPNGQTARWDNDLQRYVTETPTVEAADKKVEFEQLAGLRSVIVKRLRQLSHLIFWALVFLVLKIILSVGDYFDDYVAKPVAQGIGTALGVLVQVLFVLIAVGVLWALGMEYTRRGKPDGHTMKPAEQEQTEEDFLQIGSHEKKALPSRNRWEASQKSDAQKLI